MKTFKELVEYSAKYKGPSKEIDCDIELIIDNNPIKAYSVSVAHRDLLFYCEELTANYVVDSNGSNNSVELYHVEKD